MGEKDGLFPPRGGCQSCNIINDRIKFRRKKTGKLYDIKITDQLVEILNIYTKGKSMDSYIFPVIKREDPALQEREISWERQRYNRGLKTIAELCGIEQKLTTYVSRHSFATQAMLNDVPLQAISEMLGHSKLNTTNIFEVPSLAIIHLKWTTF